MLTKDTMKGGTLKDIMLGGDADDDMQGDDGQFFVTIGPLNDVMLGGKGDDTMRGGRGNDLMIGQDGKDTMEGDDGSVQVSIVDLGILNDMMFGSDGIDTMSGHAGSDLIFGNQGNDVIHGGGGLLDLEFGNSGDDDIDGQAGVDMAFGGPGHDTITGDDHPDILFGQEDSDVIDGNAGLDWIFGGGGDDQLHGSGGFDLMFGNPGDDWMHGDDGPDFIVGNNGNDMMSGDDGVDFLFGRDGMDVVHGDSDRDFAWGGNDSDKVHGDLWKDFVFGGDGDDEVHGGEGRDFVYGNASQDCVFGNEEDDRLFGGTGNDYIYGGDGDDRMRGDRRIASFSDGDDVMWGENGDDRMRGNEGNDQMDGGAGNDRIRGRKGQDTIYGREGNDRIWGGDNSDTIDAGSGADVVRGGADDDTIYGGTEVDKIRGGRGVDTLYGGSPLGVAQNNDDVVRGNAGSDTAEDRDGPDAFGGSIPHSSCSEIHGFKWYDTDNDGVRDDNEPLVSGVTILLDRNNDGTVDDSTMTMMDNPATHDDETGMYWFPNLVPGTYAISEVLTGNLAQTYPYPQSAHVVAVAPGQALEGINFGNIQGASIHGQKWNDLNANGMHDPNEPGLDGWLIRLYDSAGNLVRTSETMSMDLDHNGSINPITEQGIYWFANLRPGTYTVREASRPGWQQNFPGTVVTGVGTLFGVAPFGAQSHLVRINPLTGASTDVGATGVMMLGLGYSTNSNSILGVPAPTSGTVNTLYALNPLTGQATPQGNTVLSGLNIEGGFGIAAGASTGFYTSAGRLYEINLVTGAIVGSKPLVLGVNQDPLSPQVNIDGLDFLSGTLYGILTEDNGALGDALDDYLIKINTATGLITPVGHLGIDLKILAGLAADQTFSTLYASGNTVSGVETLYRVSHITGTATAIGPTGLSDLSGLTYVPSLSFPADHQVTVVSGQALQGVNFGNQISSETPGSIHGQKFHDLDANGIKGPQEPGLDNWEITIYDGTGNPIDVQLTHSMDRNGDGKVDSFTEKGLYWFEGLHAGNYVVTETIQEPWQISTPAMGSHSVNLTFGQTLDKVDFGNFLFGSIHGKKGDDLNRNDEFDKGTVTLTAGKDETFLDPLEPTSPHANLVAAFPGVVQRPYDDATTISNKYFLESLSLPSSVVGIRSATLMVRARPTSNGGSIDDTISIGVWGGTSSAADRTSSFFGAPHPGALLPGTPWNQATYPTGNMFTISLPPNVISALEAYRRLDVVIEDDTNVDFVKLVVEYSEPCPPDWEIRLDGVDGMGNSVSRVTHTMFDDPATPQNEEGMYWFDNLKPGNYVVRETLKPGWMFVLPGNGTRPVSLTSGKHEIGIDFLNRTRYRGFGNTNPATLGFPNLAAQFTHFMVMAGNINANVITFGGLTGTISPNQFLASHGVRFENTGTSSVLAEGSAAIEDLDGYDGIYEASGDNIYLVYPNHVAPFTILFDEPVSAVGSFFATGKEGSVSDLTISAYDSVGNLLTSFEANVSVFADPDNREGFWAVESTTGAEIAKVTIKNKNTVDFGNALILDNIQWVQSEQLLGDYDRNGIVDTADYIVWRNATGQGGVPPFSGADGNGDGMINQNDYDVWKANFGRTQPPTVVSDADPGDYDRNGIVDAADYLIWRNALAKAELPFLAEQMLMATA